ncbi:MAG: cell division protein FtsQ/DivIB [Gammaproteobacteria bacterium]|nr:cell division protein FtsQ/DivIB [Gammaproteobacteria bacterium]MCP5139909.1 cell division protein FtsQ/DivIB [Chromatiales bacterium]
MSLLSRRNRKRRSEPRIRLPVIPWVRITSVLGVLLLAGGALLAGRWLLNRPVEQVVINGEFERVSADRLESLLRPYMGQGFLATPLDVVQQQLAAVPWVATARVSRKWPGTLDVTVTEEQPAARWNEHGLLNPQGRLFVSDADHIPAGLPRLSGPEGTEAEVAARYVAIQEQLVHRGLALAALELDKRGAWSMRLSNGIQVRLGSQDTDIRLARFFEALDSVVAAVAADVNYIDMRYTNGFAVGWKHERAAGEKSPNA